MRDLPISVIAFQGGLLQLLQLGKSLRRIERRRGGRGGRRRDFLRGSNRPQNHPETELDRDFCFGGLFHVTSWLFFLRAVSRQWRCRSSLQPIEKPCAYSLSFLPCSSPASPSLNPGTPAKRSMNFSKRNGTTKWNRVRCALRRWATGAGTTAGAIKA